MHEEILTAEQIKLLPTVGLFKKKFGLVGGTAIALHIGHRRSIDFDLFTDEKFSNAAIRRTIAERARVDSVFRDEDGQFTLTVNGIRHTFFQYPYHIEYPDPFKTYARLPSLLTLAAMKAYALGRRTKWKDYVDLYFIIKHRHSIADIIGQARQIFKQEFNEKLFRVQLAYFPDIDYTEQVIFMPGFAVDDAIIQQELLESSLS